jgi:hypothetical protein
MPSLVVAASLKEQCTKDKLYGTAVNCMNHIRELPGLNSCLGMFILIYFAVLLSSHWSVP